MKNFCLFNFFFFLTFLNYHLGQKSNCYIDSRFDSIQNSVYNEDQNISALDIIENCNEDVKLIIGKRTLVVEFFFDETNKFHKTVNQFKSMLRDSLHIPTDIQIIYKFQRTKGSVFINNGTDKISIIHLNALIFSKDSSLMHELFGNGKLSRIDTTTTKLRNFTHEFVSIDKVSNQEIGYLYLFRGKIVGKGFACDPNEDLNIIDIFKRVYNHKYIDACLDDNLKKMQAADEILYENPYNYNIISTDIPLITSEAEWKDCSPIIPCCCYPGFDEKNKGLGLLYNFKAYELIQKNTNKQNKKDTLVCTRIEWNKIFNNLKKDPTTYKFLKLHFYPGFYDKSISHTMDSTSGYWLEKDAIVYFSRNAYTKPIIEDSISFKSDSLRKGLLALSIRLSDKSYFNYKIKNWVQEDIDFYNINTNNKTVDVSIPEIKIIYNLSDWMKYSPNQPCRCYLNFDFSNQKLGFYYNFNALKYLKKNEPTLKIKTTNYRIGTKLDWDMALRKGTMDDSLRLFNCDENKSGNLKILANAYFDGKAWIHSKNGSSNYWVYDTDDATNSIEFNCSNLYDYQFCKYTQNEVTTQKKISKELEEKEEFKQKYSAYMIKFIRK